ncbi:MAG: hypothetical protein L0229_09820 [Blastocatellia bacterium]|nr:hypothetical protein [Blastocatellia bacterium]
MKKQRYKTWWELHRRVAKGESLSDKERHAYEAGRAELEAEEWAGLRQHSPDLRSLQTRLRKLTRRNQKLVRQEAELRERAVELERQYLALTGEKLGLEV